MLLEPRFGCDTSRVLVVGGITGGGYVSPAQYYRADSNVWVDTGAMAANILLPVLIQLNNGTVLVAGGNDGGMFPETATCQLYTPATNLWALTGSMNVARWAHSGVVLPNGQALVVGGAFFDGFNTVAMSGCELFNSALATWANTGALTEARYYNPSIVLADGSVLTVGGNSNIFPGVTKTCEHYVAGAWNFTGSLLDAFGRANSSLALLQNGKVVCAGGRDMFGGGGVYQSCYLWDPATNLWVAAGVMATKRVFFPAITLRDGRVFVCGGLNDAGNVVSTTDIYDPATNAWTPVAAMNHARWYHGVVELGSGLILAYGSQAGSGATGMQSAEIYNRNTGLWTFVAALNRPHDDRASQTKF